MPIVKGGGYFKAILDHYKKTGGRDYDEDTNRHKKAEADVKEIKAKLLELELKIKQGRLLPFEEIEVDRLKRISAVKRQLLGLPRKLAPRLEGKNEAERLEMIKTEIEYCIRIFSGENLPREIDGNDFISRGKER
jgi:predicted NUDIX family NTP pyrophosphohydrolase